jgi:hypothetical protein
LDTDYLNGMSDKFRKWTLNKENIKVYLADWNKIHRFVRETTGVGSERLVSYSREERRSSLKLKYCGGKKRETRKVH